MRNPNIDRLAPTRRPNGRIVMRQQWRDLLFLHWEVPAALLQSLTPAELTLDTFDGKAYVGLVPFTMRNVRPVWSPSVPPLSNFHETNVRTYVHYKGRGPGVWFFSLDAANSHCRPNRPLLVQTAVLLRADANGEKRRQGERETRRKGEEEKQRRLNRRNLPVSPQPSTLNSLRNGAALACARSGEVRCHVDWTPEAGNTPCAAGIRWSIS